MQLFVLNAATPSTVRRLPELEKAIDQLAAGDIFILAEWDRCTRSMQDGVAVIERIHARGALVRVLDRDYLDLTKPINRGILDFLSALAQDERERIHRRASDGRKAAKARGAKFGRKPKLTEHQQDDARRRISAGETCRQVAKIFGVHHSTVSRLV